MMPQADVERARFNMVEQQIRPWDVLDQRVLDLLMRVHREAFVPAASRALAFADLEIPLGHGEVMLAPKIEARILQALNVQPTDRVLEVGTGSGYFTALLASLAAQVYTVDLHADFTASAQEKLRNSGIANVTAETGDAARGWDKHGACDVVVLTGSVPVLPASFQNSLQPGGRLFAVVGEAPLMVARLITCPARGVYVTTDLFETCLPPLRNAQQPDRFVF